MASLNGMFTEPKGTNNLGEIFDDRQEADVEWLSLTDSITNEVNGLDLSRFHVIEETCESSSLDEADGDIETEALTETPEEIPYSRKDHAFLTRHYRKPSTSIQFAKRVLKSQLTPSTSESNNSDSSIQSSVSLQSKRKAGWPKGRKRKPDVGHIRPPKAPSTGYILYMIEKRKNYKHLPFYEVTKLLGNEWTKLDKFQKKVYLDRAENDKKRYREELKTYRKSGAYQTYMKWKRSKRMVNGTEESDIDATDEVDEEDNEELYCKSCDQWFVNFHNKREHFGGKLHLSKCNQSGYDESGSYSLDESSLDAPSQFALPACTNSYVTTDNDGIVSDNKPSDAPSASRRATTIEENMSDMMKIFAEREGEISYLQNKIKSAQQINKQLSNSIASLENCQMELINSLAVLKEEEKLYRPLLLKFWSVISTSVSNSNSSNLSC